MKLREILPTLLLGLLGIVAAAAIAMAANEVSGGQIALSADPVFGVDDERLVEPGERRKDTEGAPGSEGDSAVFDDNGGASGSGDGSDADGGGNGSDDNGGSGEGGGSGSSGSGAGELEFEGPEGSNSGSGSGSSGSGSSGSGSSGSGSDDSSEHGGDDD